MNSNIEDYLLAFSEGCYELIALTETWLDDRTQSSHLFGSEYEGFRCDRGPINSPKRTGGGVLIAVHRRLKANVIHENSWNILEQVWVSVQLSGRKLFICAVYFPPDRTRDKQLIDLHIQSLLTIVSRAKPCDEIIVIGDFNLPSLFWRPFRDGFLYPDPNQSTLHVCALDLLDGYSAAGLQQINCNANENGRCLDLCFVSINDTAPLLTLAPDPLVKNVAHHPTLVLSLDDRFKIKYREPPTRLNFNFRRADFDGLLNALLTVDWIGNLNPTDIDSAVNDFSSVLNGLIDAFVPKTRNRSHKYCPWQSAELRRLKTLKKSALRRFSATGALFLRDRYRQLNYEYKRLRRRCYSNYRRHIEGKLRADPKKFWNFVNEQRKESGLPSTMELVGEKASNVAAICRMFAVKFSSVFSNETPTDGEISDAANNVPFPGHSMASINIDDNAILAAARKLKHTYSPGPDGIPATLLEKFIAGLLTPLTHLFRLSLATGRFPTTWKQAFLFPVHKKGDRSKIDNYRGISALCAISKLFELVVLQPIFSHCQSTISDDQHGFLPKRSCATNLLCLTNYAFDSFVHRHQTDVIYTDLSAAFDKVNHQITVAKLDRYGFSGNLLGWLESYLLGRTLRVKIGDEISEPFVATSGIAQGSHLGPLVFLLYFNDVHHLLKCPRLAFADDLKLFNEIKNVEDATYLQQQLNIFARWCKLNCMVLNPTKCSIITFTRKHRPLHFDYKLDGSSIQRVDHVKDLGVFLDTKLTFKQHISFIVAKAARQLGLICRMTRDFRNIQCITTLYCSLVRSSLEFCSTVWIPHYNNAIHRIESIQRRFVRYALRMLPWRQPMRNTRYEDRCQLLQLDTLQLRRETARAMVVSDVLTSRIDCPTILRLINLNAPSRTLRRSYALQLPFRRTNYSANSAIIGIQRAFNRVSSAFDFHLSHQVLRTKFISLFRNVLYINNH
ncbi:uncharacterized protein LOC129725335 [Wyeomyia smithii]|uniref:uncharacterized protein LOC129725335 n=1 Tax=Wyeomyia smithii TaxID=174621 RepID=UPI0024680B9E|nr:uncharacterized protein LOC129725335 [Wyeomyia smithii]